MSLLISVFLLFILCMITIIVLIVIRKKTYKPKCSHSSQLQFTSQIFRSMRFVLHSAVNGLENINKMYLFTRFELPKCEIRRVGEHILFCQNGWLLLSFLTHTIIYLSFSFLFIPKTQAFQFQNQIFIRVIQIHDSWSIMNGCTVHWKVMNDRRK